MLLPAFGVTLIPESRSHSQDKQIHVLCLLCYQYDVMIKTRPYRAQTTLEVTGPQTSLLSPKSTLKLSSWPLPPVCHLRVLSNLQM